MAKRKFSPADDPWNSSASAILLGTALFAFAWAVTRACTQTIIGDEADSYLYFARQGSPNHWFAAANNHVINSMLMRLFTSVFGLSHLSVRLGALIGAGIYISGAYRLARLLTGDAWLRWASLVCLVYNPFVFDYLVAARGYGMACGFLVWAIYLAARVSLFEFAGDRVLREARRVSVLLALAFCCAFPFAFVSAALLAVISAWLWRVGRNVAPASLAISILLPGFLVTILLTGSVLLDWPPGQLQDGGTSVGEMLGSMVGGSMYQLNGDLLNPLLMARFGGPLRRFLPIALLVFVVLRIAALRLDWSVLRDHSSQARIWLAVAVSAAMALAVTAHWISWEFYRLRMPRGRTALWVIPLATFVAVVLAALPSAGRFGRLSQAGLKATLIVLSFYFAGCLRLGYFKEWEWSADLRRVYPVVANYARSYCITDVPSFWLYSGSLNFYSVLDGRERPGLFSVVTKPEQMPQDKALYVLHKEFNSEFIRAQKLRIIYQGESTDVMVGLREEALTDRSRNCVDRQY